ncbi:hypothetical protein KIN20_003906 [Parelaphostrongylus tenuis]|uniref:Uncharacterized protein n=1 Tax=Parelaphostrongylus tenuis TaxID=148309 RepID=A0AAD5MJ37_PARTN|nr:hypothetical protein KIN20_003906 [Parelaphostrongylus tenuis]
MEGTTSKSARLGVPRRWMYCPKVGKVIDGLFLPFKTPLCSLYDDRIDEPLRFYVKHVFTHPSLEGRKLGLWIDFTRTDRLLS